MSDWRHPASLSHSTRLFTHCSFRRLSFLICSGVLPGVLSAPLSWADQDVGLTDQDIDVLPEMVISGEKVARSLQNTSSSVAVFDDQTIEQQALTNTHDILQMTPNVTDLGIANELPSIRGIDGSGPATGANAFLNGTRPRMNLSIDGRSFTYNELAFGPQSLWDIQQVEVFRGPQSYVQGRNAIAGAVVIRSKDPTFEWESAVKGSLGNQSYGQGAVMVSGPLIENELAFRVSVDHQRRRSDIDMPSYSPVGDPRDIDATTTRAKLLYEPADKPQLSTQFTLSHYDSQAPQNEAQIAPAEHQSPRFDIRRPVFETRSTSGIWDMSWTSSDLISFENQFIYTDFSNHRRTADSLPYADIDGNEVQIEPLVRFQTIQGNLSGIAGLRYFRGDQDEFVNLFGGSHFDDKTETQSAFAELTYALTPTLDITTTARVEHERRQREGGSQSVQVDFDETYTVFLPKLDLAWHVQPQHTFGAIIGRGYNGGGAGMTFGTPFVSYTYDEEYVWNYELYSRHRLMDDRVELTTNIFFNDYEDMQLPYYLGNNSTEIRNADKAETYGVELGARWLPIPELNLFGNIGFLKTEIKRFSDSGIEGNEMPRAPAYTVNVGAHYTFARHFEVGGNVVFSDTYYSAYDNDPRGKIDGYWQANMQLAYHFQQGRIMLFARNLFDSDDRIMVYNNDEYSPLLQQSRMIGGSIEWHF